MAAAQGTVAAAGAAAPALPALDDPSEAPIAFERKSDGYRPLFGQTTRLFTNPAQVQVPARADAAFQVTDAASQSSLELVVSGASGADAVVAVGVATYPAAFHGGDLLLRPRPDGTEQFVRIEQAPNEAGLTYEISFGGDLLALRSNGNSLEFLDGSGVARLRSGSPYLLDAEGVQWPVEVTPVGCPNVGDPAAASPGANCALRLHWSGSSVRYPALLATSWTSTGPERVLLVGEPESAGLSALQTILKGLGMDVTVSDVQSAPLAGPGLNAFDAVVMLSGSAAGHPLSPDAQSALQAYVRRGGGLVMSGWASREASAGRLTGMPELVLLEGATASNGPLSVTRASGTDGHGALVGLPSSFSIPARFGGGTLNPFAQSPATVLLQDAASRAVLAARELGFGRVTETSFTTDEEAGGESGLQPLADVNLQHLLSNSAAWVAHRAAHPELAATPNYGAGTLCFFDFQCSCTGCTATHCVNNACCTASTCGACGSCGNTNSTNPGNCIPFATGTTPQAQCGNYLCDGTNLTCPTSCTSNAVCANGYVCINNQCKADPNGYSCTKNAQCASGNCVGGTCCASANGCAPYACSATGCYSSCTTDAQCSSGYSCILGQCGHKFSTGSPCAYDVQCASNYCVDGVCCGSACSGSCDVCAASLGASADGTCTNVSGAGNPSCSPYVCSGTSPSCPATCSSDGNCIGADYCNASHQCVTKQGNGASCTGSNQCASGNCVDGFCCNTACGSSCDVCNLPSAPGTCSPAPLDSAGSPSCAPYTCDGTHVTCAASCNTDNDCASGDYCNASHQCVPAQANGGSCNEPRQCASDQCVDGFCCNSACSGACDFCAASLGASANGTCTDVSGAAGSPSCSPYLCSASSATCPSTCSSDADCVTGDYCNAAHQCVPAQINGASCSEARQCSSGSCADGVCCNSACSGTCNVCSTVHGASANGTCTVAAANFAGVGAGCSPYVCDGTNPSCPTTCTSDGNCVPGDFCNGGQCMAKQANGAACTAVNQCASGNCVDGVCCNSSCDGACDFCSAAKGATADGVCSNVAGAAGSPSCSPYLCSVSSSSCPGSCAADNQCAAGFFCSGGRCVPPQPNGFPCLGTNQCASGFCANNVCCDSACTDGCGVCAAVLGATKDGACTAISAGQVGAPSCAPYLCNGASTACPSSCQADGDCADGNYCADGACMPKKALGSGCQATDECLSGFCADGVCCGTACDSACDACAVAAGGLQDGVCSIATEGTPGNPACTPYACNGTDADCPSSCGSDKDCSAGNYCDSASHQCVPQTTNGVTCSAADQCVSGNCVDGVCCDTACDGSCDVCAQSLGATKDGTCTITAAGNAGQNPSCSPFLCDGKNAACPTSCTSDVNCVADDYCGGGLCLPKQHPGNGCTATDQCTTGFCVDGVCCDTACTDQCAVCNAPTHPGTCSPAPMGSPVGNRAACASDGSNCGGLCDGTNTQCSYPGAMTTCGAPSCANDLALSAPVCNGQGACAPGTSTSCAPYQCGPNACLSQCTSSSDCVDGATCAADGTCQMPQPLGATCSSDDGCTSGHCVDGICCESACAGACGTCSAPFMEGSCVALPAGTAPAGGDCAPLLCDGVSVSCPLSCKANSDCAQGFGCSNGQCVPVKPLGASCTSAADCESGFCADGVCCNSACDGACATCAAEGAIGTCTPVKGVPPAGKSCSGEGACGGFCDGKQDSCSYPGKDTVCSPAFCSDATAVTSSLCDGAGACTPGTKSSCLVGCQGDHCAPVPQKVQSGCSSAGSFGWGWVLGLLVLGWARRRARSVV